MGKTDAVVAGAPGRIGMNSFILTCKVPAGLTSADARCSRLARSGSERGVAADRAVPRGVGVRVRLLSDLFSITGVHPTQLPSDVWLSFDRQSADLQDLLLNEPWFLIEGLLWAGLGVAFTSAPRRRAWTLSVVSGVLLLSAVGVLSGLGVIAVFHFG